jgi:hypothetical protein
MRKGLGVLLTAVILLPGFCFAWGPEGHEIIAMVAENHLDAGSQQMMRLLLGNTHLYAVAVWADDIRSERPLTKPWHYVDIPFGSKYEPDRDCPVETSCVVGQIGRFLGVLIEPRADREQREEALKFLVHFVADIHQPMHAAREAWGGNDLAVRFLGSDRCGPSPCNLHGVWDWSLIEHTGLTPDAYAARLEQLIKAEDLNRQAGGLPKDWANESLALAQAAWVPAGTNLDEHYYDRQIKVVDRQMALAGLRLAKLLNAAAASYAAGVK